MADEHSGGITGGAWSAITPVRNIDYFGSLINMNGGSRSGLCDAGMTAAAADRHGGCGLMQNANKQRLIFPDWS